jgi:hypothetical protein
MFKKFYLQAGRAIDLMDNTRVKHENRVIKAIL